MLGMEMMEANFSEALDEIKEARRHAGCRLIGKEVRMSVLECPRKSESRDGAYVCVRAPCRGGMS
jgi:hypothetical protein